MNAKPLKLGLSIDSYEIPAWLFHSLERIADSGDAEISVVLLSRNQNKTAETEPGLSNHLLYTMFDRFDEKVFVRRQNACTTVDVHKLLGGVWVVLVRQAPDGNTEVIETEDKKRIRELGLDILINLSAHPLHDEIVAAAKYGVWYFAYHDMRTMRGGPPGLWEVVERAPFMGITLLMSHANLENDRIIYRSRFLTYPFSPARTRNTAFWASSSFLPKQVHLLHHFGEERFFEETAKFNNELNFYDRKLYQTPSNWDALKVYSLLLARDLYEVSQRIFRKESWYLMFEKTNSMSLSFAGFRKMKPPRDRFWADPQVIKKDERYFIFVEEFIYRNHKGHIAVIEMDAEGNWTESIPVLVEDHHLSYPFVFENDHQFYMIPESAQNQRIDLYECVTFPSSWKYKMTLIDHVTAVDTSIFLHEGKWWLFTGIAENLEALPQVELFLFYSDNLFSTEWKCHPKNPIASDLTCARPAGKLFTEDGNIFRPSQNCTKNYGFGFNIHQVLCLTETDYQEKQVAAVKPYWDSRLITTHTFTRVEGISIIDGATRRLKWT